jgi:tetratricopeptide (TPR) repeat protein
MALGRAYRYFPGSDRNDNLQQAIACYREALRAFTPEAAPTYYAEAQYNLGSAYEELSSDENTANLQQAIVCYQEAQRFLTPEVDPVMCRLTNGTLADLYFRQADWSAALAAYQAAIDSGEQLYRVSVSSRNKAKEVVKNTALYRKAAFAVAHLGDPAQALLLLERGKTRLLA